MLFLMQARWFHVPRFSSGEIIVKKCTCDNAFFYNFLRRFLHFFVMCFWSLQENVKLKQKILNNGLSQTYHFTIIAPRWKEWFKNPRSSPSWQQPRPTKRSHGFQFLKRLSFLFIRVLVSRQRHLAFAFFIAHCIVILSETKNPIIFSPGSFDFVLCTSLRMTAWKQPLFTF